MTKTRIERDALGEVQVPADALWGAQTERARQNFRLSGIPLPRAFLRALGLVKAAAAHASGELGLLPPRMAREIERAAREVAAGDYDAHFPVEIFQTGSGTSTNMNANEVIARLASTRAKTPVHPNDHVNLGQSSNDVIPSALLVATSLVVEESLRVELGQLRKTIDRRAHELAREPKTGRTHLMDAVPLTFGQELSAWSAHLAAIESRLTDGKKRLGALPLGGTAVGTGLGADRRFAALALGHLTQLAGHRFSRANNRFAGLALPDAALELAGTLQSLSAVLYKISGDLRLMNSGPLTGFGDIELPALQPGSSIMPGKVNPVIAEAVQMAAIHVLGRMQSVLWASASGSFQLNVTFPLLAHELLECLDLLSRAMRSLADQAISGFVVRRAHVAETLARNPILVTALNERLGYERSAKLAKAAYAEGRPILDVAVRDTNIPRAELERLLDPLRLTTPAKAPRRRK